MSDPQTVWTLSEGEYSDYQIKAVFESRDDAEQAAKAWGGGHFVEELPLWPQGTYTGPAHTRLILQASINAYGTVREVEQSYGADRPTDPPSVYVDGGYSTRFVNDDCAPGVVRVSVSGTDHKRARKVYSEQVAKAKADWHILIETSRRRGY